MTALDRNSKADTQYLGLGVTPAAVAVDQSQERTDLVDHTTYLQEASSARFALTYPRELTVCFTKKTGDEGILINHGTSTGASHTYRMRVFGTVLYCTENGSAVLSVALPDVTGTDRRFMAQWSTRPDVFDPSKVVSELTVYNFTTGAWSHAFATHTPATTNTGWDFNVGGYGAGVSAYDVTDIDTVRVGSRFHSQVEAREDWVDESTAPTIDGVLRSAALPISTGTEVGTSGEFAGPAYLWSGADARDADKRLVSPIVNVRAHAEFVIAKDDYTTPGRQNDFRPVPGATQYRWTLDHLWKRPVPPGCNRVRGRAYIRMFTVDAGPCEMFFRIYSIGNLPLKGAPLSPPIRYYGATATQQTDDAIGTGHWIDLGTCHVARDAVRPDFSTFALAHSFNNGGASKAASDTRFAVYAVQLEPYYQPSDAASGFDVALP